LALSDVYSLGIVLMIVFIKKNHSNQGLFQQEEFVKNRILEIKNPVYKSILESMLQQDPLKRKTFQEISNSLKINHFSLPFGPVTSSFLISSRNILKRNNFFEEQQCLTLMKHDTTCLKFSKDFSPDGKVLAYSLKYLKDKISGIPDLVSAYEEDGQTFVMTENLGYSLERCLIEWKKHGSRFNIFEVYSWFRPIVNIVWNCFQQGFHFNAISDANLFLNSQSQVKIVGFSRSWDLRYLPTQEFITACYSHCFTPPEVIKDLVERRAICEYDCEKADVYALGIVFYQFLTFDNASEIWFNKDSMYLEGKIKNFDTFTADLLRKMLESDPSKRLNLNQLVKMINFS
jgi:serine/threonine protein kinase